MIPWLILLLTATSTGVGIALGALWHAAHAVSDCGAAEKIGSEHRRSCASCGARRAIGGRRR